MTIGSLERLAAEIGIRRLHALCIDAVWRKDREAFVDCFVCDGEWNVAGMHFRGRAAIGDGFDQFLARNERVLMNFSSPILEIGWGFASGRTYVNETVKMHDGEGQCSVGIYYERFVEVKGSWRFVWRHFDLFYLGPPDLIAPLFALPDRGRPPALPLDDLGISGM